MKPRTACARLAAACACSMSAIFTLLVACVGTANVAETRTTRSLWEHGNLLAWIVLHHDDRARGPEERAQMLRDLGITKFAYNWTEADIPNFDAEIDALQRHGIELTGWGQHGSDSPYTQLILDTFKRHHVHPQLWVEGEHGGVHQSPEDWARELQTTPQIQRQRVSEEADRIAALVKRAAPYGVKVELYNHNGWLGMEENQLAVIALLKERGVTDVGIVYNFSHARDELHDDSKNFPSLWAKMKTHVDVVNITGIHPDGQFVYPSQGDSELDMMRTIQQSGWRGSIGLIAEKGGDAEVTLKNYLVGLDWLAAELKRPGSAGPRPFEVVP
jgi:sugar phosphate isomerase/epimerase